MSYPSFFFPLPCVPLRAILFFFVLCLPPLALADDSPPENLQLLCKIHKPAKSRQAPNHETFTANLEAFTTEMADRHGFPPEALNCIFSQVRHNPTVVQLVKPFPSGKPKNWQAYRARFIEPVRIAAGIKFWKRYQNALTRAEATYGVPPEIIVGIIGVETIYGKKKGNFRTLDALATLAFNYPEHPKREARMALFQKELEHALLLSAERGLDPLSLRGSYAGAIGWPQFLPSSIRKYAVDFDGDGKIDLRDSPVDAIGSVGNFLAQHGWKKGEPAVFQASLNENCPQSPDAALNLGLSAKLSLDDLRQVCVTPQETVPDNLLFGLVDLQNGFAPTEYWLGTDNFFAITQYNRSYFYAMSVIELGRAIQAFRYDTESTD